MSSSSPCPIQHTVKQPAPYQMCSQHECEERQRTGEVSIWERTDRDRHTDTAQAYSQSHSQSNQRPSDSRYHGRSGRGRGRKSARGRFQGQRHDDNHTYHRQQKAPPSCRHVSIDPCRAVQKYRRSAAGTETPLTRSPKDLLVTVDYLLQLLVQFRRDQEPHNKQHQHLLQQYSFASLVEFWENRVRAVQVDWVKLQHHSTDHRQCQARLVRAHILILYIMMSSSEHQQANSTATNNRNTQQSSVSSYEASFGKRALATALAQFWKSPSSNEDTTDSEQNATISLDKLMDEMLVYDALQQIQTMVAQGDVTIHAQFLESYHHHILLVAQEAVTDASSPRFPGFQWILDNLIPSLVNGNWARILSQFSRAEPPPQFSSRTWILVKCMWAPTLSTVRWKALQTYNTTWMKGESVQVRHVAELLHIPDEARALAWIEACGLPLTTSKNTDGDGPSSSEQKVVLKAQPIQPWDSVCTKKQSFWITRHDDAMVFGTADGFWMDPQGIRLPPTSTLELLLLSDDNDYE